MSQLDVALPEKETQTGESTPGPVILPKIIRQNYVPILLGLIVLLAFFLRFYDLTGNPPGLNQDEAVNGVDAYSLSQTLRDHHGNFLPVLLQSFDDWASSLLTYLTIPFVWVLGLSEFSVRLPVVLLGAASIPVMHLYIKKITGQTKLALLGAFLLAIMPWHILYTRWAVPPNIIPFFLPLLLYISSLVEPTEKKLWKVGLIGFGAALLVYTYSTQKMFIPLLLGIFFISDLLTKIPFKALIRKYLVIGLTFLVLTSPVYLMALLDPRTNARFNGVSIFGEAKNPLIEFVTHYLNYFNPIYIFDGSGTYFFLALFYYLGILGCIHRAVFKNSSFTLINRQQSLVILGWWLVTPIAASLTRDTYNSMRTLHGYPLTIIFTVLGFAIVSNLLKTRFKKLPGLGAVLYCAVLIFSVYLLVFFMGVYFGPYREFLKQPSQYGIAQFSEYLVQHKSEFDTVTVDSHINQPYIYYLFYSKEDPHQYNYAEISYPKNGQDGIMGIPKLDNYFYAKIDPAAVAGATELLTVKDENGFVYYKVYARGRQWYVQMQYDNGYDPPS